MPLTLNIIKPIYTITLDNQNADIQQGTTEIYEKHSLGFYLNFNTTVQMTPSSNGIIIPEKDGYIFQGYYTQTNGEGIQYIDENGRLTISADASNFVSHNTLYAYYIEDRNTLYNVLKKAAKEGTYAKEYIGNHQDSMDLTKTTEKIYHWYGSNETDGTLILNKNNVVFANQCWQMIRTTDTGGVRLLYNGEPTITVVDGEMQYDCGSTRPSHIGGIKTTQSLSGSFYYGDGYTTSVSGTTTTYTLTNARQVTINSTNADTEIPKIAENYPYTCRSTSETGTCKTLYKVDSQSSGVKAYVYGSTNRDSLGTTAFNSNTASMGDVGYMYNSKYPTSQISISKSIAMLSSVTLDSKKLVTYGNYYYGDGYNLSENNYVLSNAVKGNTIADNPSTWVGMYQCDSNSSSSCTTAYYVAEVDTSGTNPIMYRATLANGKTETDSTYKYLFGEGLQDNGDGTFSLTGNIEEIAQKDWNTKYSSMTNKFVCFPGYYSYDSTTGVNTCYDTRTENKVDAIGYVSATTITNFTYSPVYKYGFGFEPSGSNYKLIGNNSEEVTLQYIYNWANTQDSNCFTNSSSISDCGYKTLSKSHYTCYNLSGECSTYYYIIYTDSNWTISLPLTDSKNVSTDLTDKNNVLYLQLYQNDENGKVNTKNSIIKEIVDTWYKNTLLNDFDRYIDDTIYCNNRSIKKFGGFNPNGGQTHTNYSLQYSEYSRTSTDLSCPNTTDKFSISNNDAKLTYKVGLMSLPEMNLLNQNTARITTSVYWLISPYYFNSTTTFALFVSNDGSFIGSGRFTYAYSVRPAISLVSGLEYEKGDGSTTNPYIVNLNSKNS